MDRRYAKRIERYWTKMLKDGNEAFSQIDVNEWFDHWHTHPDWDGKGNSKPENRKRANELTFQFLKKAETLTQHRKNEIQCWAVIDTNTMDNAVYLHTKNPNGSEFPFKYEDVNWNIKNKEIEEIINTTIYEIGEFIYENEYTYYIRKKA